MTVEEFIKQLNNFSSDAVVNFYNFMRGDDIYMRSISVSDDDTEIFINIG